ncbi:MAG: conjugal transfer protein TraI [Sphingomonas sp. 67-36]|nr:MAG: conjugal transfer protein TraI [Sphingomonas sp. 67-36]
MSNEPQQEDTAPAEIEPAVPVGPATDAAEAFRIRADPPRVMRLSKKTLAVIGIVAGTGIGGSLIYALQPRSHVAATNVYDTDARNKADVVTSAPSDYSKVPKLGPALPGDLGRPILSAQANGQNVPTPPIGAQPPADPAVMAAAQARQRAAQERDTARTSKLFLGSAAPAAIDTNPAAPGAPPATATATAGQSADQGSTPAPTDQASKRAFLQNTGNRTTASLERLAAPASPNIVQAGSIIPAALITGIRSDLPGQITAQVTQNVYDSPTGRILLIPQGARLIGEYDSQVSAGQNRVLLAWDRLIMPDGRSILLDRQPGADARGYAGLQDGTNYHWGNMLKAALVSTLLGVGTEFATKGDDELLRALRYGTQDTINQSGRQLVQREVNVPPTLTIRPGAPLRVMVTRDLILDPISGGR